MHFVDQVLKYKFMEHHQHLSVQEFWGTGIVYNNEKKPRFLCAKKLLQSS